MTHIAQPAHARCLGCEHGTTRSDAPRPSYLCPACTTQVERLLAVIRDGYPRLDATPHGSGAGLDGARLGGTSFGSRPAARVDVLALTTAPAQHAPGARFGVLHDAADAAPPAPDSPLRADARALDQRTELLPTLVALARVADFAREDGLLPALTGPRTVTGECLRLAAPDVLAQLPHRWWIGDALAVLRAAAAAIRRALDEVEPSVPLGPCPRKVMAPLMLDEHGAVLPREVSRCTGQVRSRDAGHAAACPSCGHRWIGPNAVHALAGRIGDAHLDAPALAGYLEGLGYGEQPVERLRKWAQLDGWERRPAGRRVLYRLGDALTSARKRRGAPRLTVGGAA